MTQADLGLADAYINGDFSFVDKKEGLLNFFMVRSINPSSSNLPKTNMIVVSKKLIFWYLLLRYCLAHLFHRFLLPAEMQVRLSQN
jgi:hypothetical protein